MIAPLEFQLIRMENETKQKKQSNSHFEQLLPICKFSRTPFGVNMSVSLPLSLLFTRLIHFKLLLEGEKNTRPIMDT